MQMTNVMMLAILGQTIFSTARMQLERSTLTPWKRAKLHKLVLSCAFLGSSLTTLVAPTPTLVCVRARARTHGGGLTFCLDFFFIVLIFRLVSLHYICTHLSRSSGLCVLSFSHGPYYVQGLSKFCVCVGLFGYQRPCSSTYRPSFVLETHEIANDHRGKEIEQRFSDDKRICRRKHRE